MDQLEIKSEKSSTEETPPKDEAKDRKKVYEFMQLVEERLQALTDLDVVWSKAGGPMAFLSRLKLKEEFQNLDKELQLAIKNDLEKLTRALEEERNRLQLFIKRECYVCASRIKGLPVKEFYDNYRALSDADAIADLLAGKLHRLDPVIGDLGCQWRVPFILDVHAALREHCRTDLASFDIDSLLQEYDAIRSVAPTFQQILEVCRISGTIKVKIGGSQSSERFVHSNIFATNESIAACVGKLKASKFNTLREKVETFLTNWNKADGFNALRYLQLCKLLTTNRVRTFDGFGLSGTPIEFSLPNADEVLSSLHADLSNYSMFYMIKVCKEVCDFNGIEDTSVAPEKVPTSLSTYLLMKDHRFLTMQQNTKFETNVCYGPLRALFIRQSLRNQPIVIDLRRLICKYEGGKFWYYPNGAEVLYYAPDGKGGFTYVPEPKDEDQKRVALICEAASVLLKGDKAKVPEDEDSIFCTENFDEFLKALVSVPVMDLILFGISSHPELPKPIWNGRAWENENVDNRAMEAYRKVLNMEKLPEPRPWVLSKDRLSMMDNTEWDLLTEKFTLRNVLSKFGATTSQYKRPMHGDRTRAERTAETMIFAPIHIFGSTYFNKRQALEDYRMQKNPPKRLPQLVKNTDCTLRPD